MNIFLPVAILLLALALLLFGMAWLAGHRTPIPVGVKPAVFWYPGLLLLVLSAGVALTPSVVAWNRCASACAQENNPDNAAEVEACFESSSRSIGRDLLKKDDTLTEADVERYLTEHAAEIRAQCELGVVGSCTEACFAEARNPRAGADAVSM